MSEVQKTDAVEPQVEVFEFPEKEVQSEHYETLMLVAGTASEEEAAAAFEGMKKEITEVGGTITFEEAWGRKKLAYTVAHSKHGYYFVVEFDAEKNLVADINTRLRNRKDITRFLTVKKKELSAEEQEEMQRIREKIVMRSHKAAKEEEAEAAKKDAEEVAKKKAAAKAAEAESSEEVKEEQPEAPAEEKAEAPAKEEKLDELLDKDLEV